MEIPANYIRRIEIHGLWHRYDIAWDLRPDVNILAGINGVGKTTILNRSVGYLEQTTGQVKNEEKNGVRVFFDRPDATFIPYDVIRSYDRPLVTGDFTARMADPEVRSELDWQLYLLQRRYLDYQVNVGNRMIELLSGTDEQRAQAPALSEPKRKFQDLIDGLFAYTGKKIDRRSNDIVFLQGGERLSPGSLAPRGLATEAHRHDTPTEPQPAAHPHHPLARRHHGGLAGRRDRGERDSHGTYSDGQPLRRTTTKTGLLSSVSCAAMFFSKLQTLPLVRLHRILLIYSKKTELYLVNIRISST